VREKKDATQKKIKNFQFAQKQYPKNTHKKKPILLEIEPHKRRDK